MGLRFLPAPSQQQLMIFGSQDRIRTCIRQLLLRTRSPLSYLTISLLLYLPEYHPKEESLN